MKREQLNPSVEDIYNSNAKPAERPKNLNFPVEAQSDEPCRK